MTDPYTSLMVRQYSGKPSVLDCIKAAIRGDNVVIDYYRTTKKGYVKSIRILKKEDVTDTQLFEQGYKAGVHLLEGWRYILIRQKHTFARIHYFGSFDARTMGNLETSSTLNDHFESKAEALFMKHLVQIRMDPLDLKRIGIIAAGILAGVVGYFLVFGGM